MQRFAMTKITACLSTLALAAFALAQDAPALSPSTTSPATAPHVRHVAVLPPGLHAITVGSISVYCLPADDAWVKTAIASAKPASRPSTMPSDLLASFKAHRSELVQQFTADMAMSDDKAINEALDSKLMPMLEKFDNLKPAIIFMPVTQKTLSDVMRAGWTDPHYHFNRAANDAVFNPTIELSWDYQLDDLVRWIKIDPEDEPEKRDAKVAEQIEGFNSFYYPTISQVARDIGLRNTLAEIILKTVVDPLKLPANLDWFGRGIATIYAVKYTVLISGESRRDLTLSAVLDEPGNPLHSQPLDLIHIKSRDELRPEYWPMYQHGLGKKGASVVNAWITHGGDGMLARTLPKIRAAAPADAPALAKLIQETTGFDISLLLPPNYKVIVIPTAKQ